MLKWIKIAKSLSKIEINENLLIDIARLYEVWAEINIRPTLRKYTDKELEVAFKVLVKRIEKQLEELLKALEISLGENDGQEEKIF